MFDTTNYSQWQSILLREPISFRHLKRLRFRRDVPVREAFHTSTTRRFRNVLIVLLYSFVVNNLSAIHRRTNIRW